jgi:dipicolinate synthase subunit A
MAEVAHSTVAVLGGDKRELEIIRSFLAAGWDVRTFGTIPSEEYAGLAAGSLADALRGADVIVGPMPGVGTDNALFAPHAAEPLRIDAGTLAAAKPGAIFFSGRSTATMRAAGETHGVTFQDIGEDDYVQVQHAIPTAEAAIALTVNSTEETVNGARALVLGYGRIAQFLAQYLRGFGAATTVAARRPEVRARAAGLGHRTTTTDRQSLCLAVGEADLVYATAPVRLLDRTVLDRVPRAALVIDLASPPGGVDHDAARDLGVRCIWARAQADSAWRHSGRAQFEHMAAALRERCGDRG